MSEMYEVIRHSAGRQYKHRYIAKIPINGGGFRYFYDKEELDAYMTAKNKVKAATQTPAPKPIKKETTADTTNKGKTSGSGGGGGGKGGSGGGGKGSSGGKGKSKGKSKSEDTSKKDEKKKKDKKDKQDERIRELRKLGKTPEEIAKILGIPVSEVNKFGKKQTPVQNGMLYNVQRKKLLSQSKPSSTILRRKRILASLRQGGSK